jgi:hypothetical protein
MELTLSHELVFPILGRQVLQVSGWLNVSRSTSICSCARIGSALSLTRFTPLASETSIQHFDPTLREIRSISESAGIWKGFSGVATVMMKSSICALVLSSSVPLYLSLWRWGFSRLYQ